MTPLSRASENARRGVPITAYGPFLHGMRLAAGVSQREVARRSGMSADTVRRLERGELRTGADKLLRYGDALGVPLEYGLVPKGET